MKFDEQQLMKVGDYVGWSETWSDAEGCIPAGLIVSRSYDGEWFDLLKASNGEIMYAVEKEEIVVMFKSRKQNESR
tara:strand:- start:7521 stop:7748 length:228 start_codon:yes stop_codon:yes gene_type:complete